MKKIKTADIATVSLGAALMCICSWIQIPSAIPFTLQTFALFFIATALGFKKSLAATVVYIFLGAVGLPVFSGFQGGIGALMGATGGFILAFIPASVIVSLTCKKFGKGVVSTSVCCLAGLFVCYAAGVLWYSFVYGGGKLLSGFFVCVLPFIIPDIAKILLAATVSKRIKPIINK